MSLVAYASSDESESDSESAPESEAKAGDGLFSKLPPPKQDFQSPPQAQTEAYTGPFHIQAAGGDQGSTGFYGPPGIYGPLGFHPPGYGPPPNYGPPSYGTGPPNYPASQGPTGYGSYVNSQGSGSPCLSYPGYSAHGSGPANYATPGLNLPPPQGGHGLIIPPPQGNQGLNLPPPQGSNGSNNMPPHQCNKGLNDSPHQGGQGPNLAPQGGQGMNLPPPQGGQGMNLPPPQGGQGMNLPPPQGGQGMNLPPPQGGQGMHLPPPQGGQGMHLPPPQGGQGMHLPPPQGGQGMNLPPPQAGQGMNLLPPQGAHGMNLPPPQGAHGMNLPPPHGHHGMSLPPLQGSHGMNLPPPQGAHGMNLPPPHGAHTMNMPPPQGAHTMNMSTPPQGVHGMNLPPPQVALGMNLPPPPQGSLGINLPPPQGGQGMNQLSPSSMGGHGMSQPPPRDSPGLSLSIPQGSQGLNHPSQLSPSSNVGGEDQLSPHSSKITGYGHNFPLPAGETVGLPKPKKRSEPVKISVPELRSAGSDSEEDEPTKKRPVHASKEGFGLSALLPQPKNANMADSKRQTLPYNFTKKASDTPSETKIHKNALQTKPRTVSKSEVSHTPSPSAIKAAAKNAALQVTKQITQEEEESDEEFQQGNFFSLSETPNEIPAVNIESYTYSVPTVKEDPPPGTEPVELPNDAANAPLEFKTQTVSNSNTQWGSTTGEEYSVHPYSHYPEYGNSSGSSYYQDYYNSEYFQNSEGNSSSQRETASNDSSFMEDEAFKRLQGKRNRGREEINFVEIKGDDQLSGNQQYLTKALTEEKNMKSFSKKKGEQPTGQQRRKHQITYLIHQAKERELELKNTWSDNKLSRRQTQAKYGF